MIHCWTCGGDPHGHPSGAPCICGGSGTHEDEVTNLRLTLGDVGGKLNYCTELLRDLLPYVERSLPTHKERGGDADRQQLLRRMNKVLSQAGE